MSVTVNGSPATNDNLDAPSHSVSITVGSLTNGAVLVGHSKTSTETGLTCTSDQDGAATSIDQYAPLSDSVAWWVLINPSAATHVFTINNGSARGRVVAIALEGVHQTTPTGTVSQDNDTSVTSNSLGSIASASGDLVFCGINLHDNDVGLAPSGSETSLGGAKEFTSSAADFAYLAAVGSTTSMGFSWSFSQDSTITGFAVKQAGASAATTRKLINGGLVNSGLINNGLIHRSIEKLNGIWRPVYARPKIQVQGA